MRPKFSVRLLVSLVIVRRKVPVFTDILGGILACAVLLFFLMYVFMLPARLASLEMKSIYFLRGIPMSIKALGAISLPLIVLGSWVYYKVRIKIDGILTLTRKEIVLTVNEKDETIPVRRIKQIYANDLTDHLRRPKGILQLIIRSKSGRRYSMRLKDYEVVEKFMPAIAWYNAPVAISDSEDLENDEEYNEHIKRP